MENQETTEDPAAISNTSTLTMTDNHMEENISAAQKVNEDIEIIFDSKEDLEDKYVMLQEKEIQEPTKHPAISNTSTLTMTDNHMEENISAAQKVNEDIEIIFDSKNNLEITNENINSILNPKDEKNEKKEDTVMDSDNVLSDVIPSTEDTVRDINNSNEKNISIANSEDKYVMLEESDNINHQNQAQSISFTTKMNILDDVQNEDNEIKQDYLEFNDSDSFEVSNENDLKECPYSCDLDECNLNSGQINNEFLPARGELTQKLKFFISHDTDYIQNDDKLLSSSAPSSPPGSQKSSSPDSSKSSDSTLGENETASLPYFLLPNPELEEFFEETEKKLQVPEIKNNKFIQKEFEHIVFTIGDGAPKSNSGLFSETSEEPQKMSEPKDRSDIVFTIEDDALKSNSETSRNSSSNDYNDFLASMQQLDDSRCPGIKRLALKEYLKKKIEEKKLLSFQRSRESTKYEEMEEGYKENVHSESSTNDFEEEIVSFGEEPCKSLDEKSNSQELSNDETDDDLDFDDDDDDCPRKTKRVPILDDSSDESDSIVGDKCDEDSNVVVTLKCSCCDSKTCGEIENNENIVDPSKNDIEEDINMSADYFDDYSPTNSNDRVFPNCSVPDYSPTSSNCSVANYFDDCSPTISNDGNDFRERIAMSPSIPSYQLETEFCNEEEFDANPSEMMHPLKKERDLKSEKKNFLTTTNLIASFGLKLDDPPISVSENVSDMFSSQDLVNVCSGVFKSDLQKTEFGLDKKEYFDKEPGKNCTKMDDLPQEKIQDYFDNEAELSGDDDGFDDQEVDYDEDENELYEAEDNELPAEEELRDEIADLHIKHVRDDDDELLKQIQEKFLDDGELNNDGKGRIRKYAWKNNDIGDTFGKNRESSSDSEESLDETWSSVCKEKAKWREENEKEDDLADIYPSYKKPRMKINIIGKSESSKCLQPLSNKRPRGSFLNLDDDAANRVLKKLKVSDDSCSGSRSTKHFLFLNDPSEDTAVKGAAGVLPSKAVKRASGNLASKAVKGASGDLTSKSAKGASDDNDTSDCGSVFNKM